MKGSCQVDCLAESCSLFIDVGSDCYRQKKSIQGLRKFVYGGGYSDFVHECHKAVTDSLNQIDPNHILANLFPREFNVEYVFFPLGTFRTTNHTEQLCMSC
jgi:hypothetical protein